MRERERERVRLNIKKMGMSREMRRKGEGADCVYKLCKYKLANQKKKIDNTYQVQIGDANM